MPQTLHASSGYCPEIRTAGMFGLLFPAGQLRVTSEKDTQGSLSSATGLSSQDGSEREGLPSK